MARNPEASSSNIHGAVLLHPGGTNLLQMPSRVNPCLGCVGFAAHAQAGPPPSPCVDRGVLKHLKIYKMCLEGRSQAGPTPPELAARTFQSCSLHLSATSSSKKPPYLKL